MIRLALSQPALSVVLEIKRLKPLHLPDYWLYDSPEYFRNLLREGDCRRATAREWCRLKSTRVATAGGSGTLQPAVFYVVAFGLLSAGLRPALAGGDAASTASNTQCCRTSKSGTATCQLKTPQACQKSGGIDKGPGTCSPNPCGGATSTTTTTTTTLPPRSFTPTGDLND